MTDRQDKKPGHRTLPITHSEDVEFSEEHADSDDRKAQERAAAADRREENGQ